MAFRWTWISHADAEAEIRNESAVPERSRITARRQKSPFQRGFASRPEYLRQGGIGGTVQHCHALVCTFAHVYHELIWFASSHWGTERASSHEVDKGLGDNLAFVGWSDTRGIGRGVNSYASAILVGEDRPTGAEHTAVGP